MLQEQLLKALMERIGSSIGQASMPMLGTGSAVGSTVGASIPRPYTSPGASFGDDLSGQNGGMRFEDMLGDLESLTNTQNATQGSTTPGRGNSQAWENPYDKLLEESRGRRGKARENYLSTFDEPQEELPGNVMPAFRTADAGLIALPAAILALFGKTKEAGVFLENALGGKMKKAEMDTQLGREQYNQRQKQRDDKQNRAAAMLKFAETDSGEALDLSENARKEKLAEDRQRAVDGRSMRSAYLASNHPGEVQTIARQLRELYPEFAPTIEEEQRQIESLSRPDAKMFNDNLRRYREASYFENDTQMEAAMGEYAKQRGQLIAAGVPERLLDPIPDTKTIKQFRAESAKNQQEKMYQLAQDKFKFDKDFKLKGREWDQKKFGQMMGYRWQTRADNLAKNWAQLELARANYGLAAERNDISKMRMFITQENKSAELVAKQMTERVDELQRLANARHAELLKAKWKPEKIAADPVLAEFNTRIETYLDEASTNNIQLIPGVRPTMSPDGRTQNWNVGPQTFQSQVPPTPGGGGGTGGGNQPPPMPGNLGGSPGGGNTPIIISPDQVPGNATPKYFGSQDMTPKPGNQAGASKPSKVVDPWVEMQNKIARASRLRKMAIEKIKFVGENGKRYDPKEIRRIYEKETGLKADF